MKKAGIVLAVFVCLGIAAAPAQAGKLTRKTAEGKIVFESYKGGAGAAENEWAQMTLAGYRFQAGRMALAWHFGFKPKVADLAKVEIWDISKAPVQLVLSQDKVELKDGAWYVSTELKDFTLADEPWLIDKKTTERFYKIILTNTKGESKALYQMAMFDKWLKLGTLKAMKGE